MNIQELTRIYIIEPNQHIQIINIPKNKHHYVGYVEYIKKQMAIDPRLAILKKLLNVQVTDNTSVLVSNKIFKKLEELGYFVIQTWYLENEQLFYMKHSKIPQNKHTRKKITELFQALGFLEEHFIEEYHGSTIYQRKIEWMHKDTKLL